MEQDQPAEAVEQEEAWVDAKAKVEAEWAGPLLQDLGETVYARAVAISAPMLLANHVVKKSAQNVEHR